MVDQTLETTECEHTRETQPPADAAQRQAAPPVVVYTVDRLPPYDRAFYDSVRRDPTLVSETIVPPRDACTFTVPKGHLFRIVSVEGPQVGDLNLWNAHDLSERFFSGKTRALHATHVTTGDRLWSTLPYFRPPRRSRTTRSTGTASMRTAAAFTTSSARVAIPTRSSCSAAPSIITAAARNLTRALATATGLPLAEAERHVHDVLNVFMCTGFTRDTHQYFMKASPVRPGDFIEFFAEIDLLGALSACPGGDCSATHSSDAAKCWPLKVEVWRAREGALDGWKAAEANRYSREHGME